MVSTNDRLLVLGVDPFAEVRCTGFADGDCLWDLSLRQRTGDGKIDGETCRTIRVPNIPVCMLYIIC
jgi:hypothetical protein